MTWSDYRALISELPNQTRQQLVSQSDGPGLLHLAGHWGAIVLCGGIILAGIPFWPALMIVQGVLIVFVFTALHETIHLTAFRSDRLNLFVANACGFAVFLPPRHFRYFHLAHHRFTQDPARDPELATPKAATPWQYLRYISGLPEWVSRVRGLFKNAFVPNTDVFVPERGRRKVMLEARWFLAGYAALLGISLTFQSTALVWVWLVPIVLGHPALRGYLLAEHARCPTVADMLQNTRTVYTNPVMRFLAWNMPFHVEHHALPAVPFHKLPAFHQFLKDHLVHTENGYLRFNAGYFQATKNGQTAAPQEA